MEQDDTKVNDVWQFVIYDAFGKLVAEYGGMSATDEGGVKYVLSDWQGSVRASLSNSGYVKSRTDYQAFGEEIQSGVGMRSSAQGFGGGTGTRQGYGLTEKDDSTGLNHTWFRKNENRAGRWTSPDPYNGSASLGNPQSFNRYSYVENQPTNFVDPSGLLLGLYCSVGFEWRPHIEGGGDWVVVQRCYLVEYGGDTGRRGPSEPEVGGGGEKTDCEELAEALGELVEHYSDSLIQKVRVGTALANWALEYRDTLIKQVVTGFRQELVTNGQNSDVYRHVAASAASVLIEIGIVSAYDDLRNRSEVNNPNNTLERQLEEQTAIDDNKAGRIVGNSIADRIRGGISSEQLVSSIKYAICQ